MPNSALRPEDVNKLSDEIIKVFQGESSNVSSLISDTADLTNSIADKDAVIGDLITNLTKVLDTVNRNDEQFTSLLDNTEQLVTGLAAQRGSVGSAITSLSNLTAVTASIQRGWLTAKTATSATPSRAVPAGKATRLSRIRLRM